MEGSFLFYSPYTYALSHMFLRTVDTPVTGAAAENNINNGHWFFFGCFSCLDLSLSSTTTFFLNRFFLLYN